METTKITLNEQGLNSKEFRSFACNLINHLVISYNIQSSRCWEKNHSDNSARWDEQVERLTELKNLVKQGMDDEGEVVNVKLTIEFESTTKDQLVESEELLFHLEG